MFQMNRTLSPTTVTLAWLTTVMTAGGTTPPAGANRAPEEQLAPKEALRRNDQTANSLAQPWTEKVFPVAFVEAYRKMFSFRALAVGWDGHGSKAILDDSVNAALAFLAMLPSDLPPPEASAASDGTVDWYWRNGLNAATVTFYKDRKAAYFALIDNSGVKNGFKSFDEIPAPLIESLRQL